MDFEEETRRMRLRSVHPGVSVATVRENTGFELAIPASVPETDPPLSEELEILRTRVDTAGRLRR
jgi:glutaconate CoA-transferase subunit B